MTGNCSGSLQNTPPPSTDERQPHSIKVMEFVDRLKPPMRALVHEFGVDVVHGMFVDGHRDPVKLREELAAWRERQQERWLAEIPYPRKVTRNAPSVPGS